MGANEPSDGDNVEERSDSDIELERLVSEIPVTEGEEFTTAIAIVKEEIDINVIDSTPPPLYRLGVSLFSIVSYIGAYVVDVMLLEQYYSSSQYLFFWITIAFIIIPSVIIQLLSCKWFHDDNGKLKLRSIVLHIFLLGPLERYWYILVYGKKARASTKDKTNKKIYLENWRDASMLRFLYAFLETGPQVTLQIYILLEYDLSPHAESITEEHKKTIIKIMVIVGSLALSMVTYNDDLRATQGGELSIIGFASQIIYRLLMIASRILTLVLFTMQFGFIVLAVLFIHFVMMILWVQGDDTKFFTKDEGKYNDSFEMLFKLLMGFIYTFSYITMVSGPTAVYQRLYYLLLYMENISMMVAWVLLNDRGMDRFEIIAISVVCAAMLSGVVFMLLYYKVFHPRFRRKDGDVASGDRERPVVLTGKGFFGRNVYF